MAASRRIRKQPPAAPPPPPPPPELEEEPAPESDATEDDDLERIVLRPDGYHWIALDGKQEFGPFETIEAARADMQEGEDEEAAPVAAGETLHEAERDIGIADWIDPETGEPAEGQSPPHLEEE